MRNRIIRLAIVSAATLGFAVAVGPQAQATCEPYSGGPVFQFTPAGNASVRQSGGGVDFAVDPLLAAKACGEVRPTGKGHVWVDGKGANGIVWTPADGYVAVGNDNEGDPDGNSTRPDQDPDGQEPDKTVCVGLQGGPGPGYDSGNPPAPNGVPKGVCPA